MNHSLTGKYRVVYLTIFKINVIGETSQKAKALSKMPFVRSNASRIRTYDNIVHVVVEASWRLKSKADRLIVEQHTQANNKGYIKAPPYWSFVRGIHRWPVDSPHKGTVMQQSFPCPDVIMDTYVVLVIRTRVFSRHAVFSQHRKILRVLYRGQVDIYK